MKMKEAVKVAANDPEGFAKKYLEAIGTDALEQFIRTIERIHWDKGCHK